MCGISYPVQKVWKTIRQTDHVVAQVQTIQAHLNKKSPPIGSPTRALPQKQMLWHPQSPDTSAAICPTRQ